VLVEALDILDARNTALSHMKRHGGRTTRHWRCWKGRGLPAL
jgi:hypothetical protein